MVAEQKKMQQNSLVEKFLALPKNQLVSGMFSDSLDKMDYRHQVITGWMCNNSKTRVFGLARTVLIKDMDTDDENIHTGLSFLESLHPGEIMVVKGSMQFAYFGELMSRLSIRQQLQSVFIDGLTRDTSYTMTLSELPIFAKGYSPVDIKGRGRVEAVDIPINVDGVKIQPGNLIYADNDGMVVIPDAALDGLYARITACLEDEEDIIQRINRGESILDILAFHKEF